MFSEEDILEIYRSFPPKTRLHSENSERLSLLINTISGSGFVTGRSLQQSFEHVVSTRATRYSLADASCELDVDFDVVFQLVRTNPTLALLSQDGQSIVPRQERDAILDDLEECLNKRLTYKAEFAQSHELHRKSLDSLLRSSHVMERIADETEEYLLGEAYAIALSNAINNVLEEGSSKAEATVLTPASLPGIPPIWLLRKCLDLPHGLDSHKENISSLFHVEEREDSIHCKPKKSILSKRDKSFDQLCSGETFCLDRKKFSEDFKELYQSSEDLDKHLAEFLSVNFVGNFAVSTERLSNAAGKGVHELKNTGFVDLLTTIPSDTPPGIQDEIQHRIAEIIAMTCSGKNIDVRRVDHFICTADTYNNQRTALLGIAKTQAVRHWELLQDDPGIDVKFQMTEVLASIPNHEELLRSIAQQKESEAIASDHFWGEISWLESKNETEFSRFWVEKVSPRIKNYSEGLGSVEDAKLYEQLIKLLSNYLQKDFLPDMVAKAWSQGLICSRKTRKNVQKLETTLKVSASNLTSTLSAVDKFGKKQGIPGIETDSTNQTKRVLVQDIIRRMQKPKTDAPLMFLSLVIVLFAKYHTGVIYATGKFAPKLLKQLRTKLDGGEYEQVEKWKELAKAGTLPNEDRGLMVQMAEAAFA